MKIDIISATCSIVRWCPPVV